MTLGKIEHSILKLNKVKALEIFGFDVKSMKLNVSHNLATN